MALTAVLDIDGTLVDTNYHHTIAWYRAFRRHDLVLPIWRIHRSIGMGGDQLVPVLAGEDWEAEHGEDVRATEKECYFELIEEVEPLPGARDLIQRLKDDGHAVVLASSAKQDEVDHYLDQLDARELADAWTMADDVEVTKPAPDLVKAALDKVDGPDGAVMLGDSTFDCEAAARADVPTVAVLTGGFSRDELQEAGAVAVYESLEELLEQLEDTPFARADGG
jgi:HAD superfamily hydrolase (TIGR01549 family)